MNKENTKACLDVWATGHRGACVSVTQGDAVAAAQRLAGAGLSQLRNIYDDSPEAAETLVANCKIKIL